MALMLSIVLPALSGVRERGRQTVCLANLRSLGLSTQAAMNHRRSLLPYAEPGRPANDARRREDFARVYADELSSGSFRCPSDPALVTASSEEQVLSYSYWPGELMRIASEIGHANVARTVTRLYDERASLPVFSDHDAWHGPVATRQAVFFGSWHAARLDAEDTPFDD